jgi:hypothetical protein
MSQQVPVTANKEKAHIRYVLSSGERVPGVTTITGELGWGKEALVAWANRLGLQGISSSKTKDHKAEIGTLAHAMVEDHLQGKKVDYLQEYSKETIGEAENSFLSFLENEKGHLVKPLLIEKPLVHEFLKYGGTIDIYGECEDGTFELTDLKSGSGIYPEHKIQVVAYVKLLEANGYPVQRARILNIPRTNDEQFIDMRIEAWDEAFEIFKHLLAIYQLKKRI